MLPLQLESRQSVEFRKLANLERKSSSAPASVHRTECSRNDTNEEMCAVRGIVSSPPAQYYDTKRKKKPQRVASCRIIRWERLSSDVLVLRRREKCRHLLISALSNESWTMTAIDHHSTIGDSNCANSTIATVKYACAGAVVLADAVLVLVGLQNDRRLRAVDTNNPSFFISSAKNVFIQSLLASSRTVLVIIFILFKDCTVASRCGNVHSVLGFAMIIFFACPYFFLRDSPLLV